MLPYRLPAPIPKSTHGDPAIRKLLDALDAPRDADIASEAVEALCESTDPGIVDALLERLEAGTKDIAPTEEQADIHATLSDAQKKEADEILRTVFFAPVIQRGAYVERVTRALLAHDDPRGERELVRVMSTSASMRVRYAIANVIVDVPGSKEALLEVAKQRMDGAEAHAHWLRAVAMAAAVRADPATAFDRLAKDLETDASELINAIAVHGGDTLDPRWYAVLAPFLVHQEGGVQISTQSVFSSHPHPAAGDALLELAKAMKAQPPRFYGYALQTIGASRDKRLARPVLELLESGACGWDGPIRALGEIGDASILPELEALLAKAKKEKDKLRKPAVLSKLIEALGGGKKKKTAAKKQDPDIPWEAPPALSKAGTGDAALDAILDDLDGPGAEKAGKQLFGRAPGTAMRLVARLQQVVEGVCNFDWDEDAVTKRGTKIASKLRRVHGDLGAAMVRRAQHARWIANAIVSYHEDEAEALVLTLATTHANAGIRGTLADALLRNNASIASLEVLAERFDADAHCASDAAFLLGPDRAYDLLSGKVGDDMSATAVMQAARRHLRSDGDRRWVDLACKLIESNDLAFSAISLLQAMPDARAVEPLLGLIRRQVEGGYAGKDAVLALAAIGDPRGAAGALDVLESPHMTVDFGLVASLVPKFGDKSIIPRVRQLIDALRKAKKKDGSGWRDPKHLESAIEMLEG